MRAVDRNYSNTIALAPLGAANLDTWYVAITEYDATSYAPWKWIQVNNDSTKDIKLFLNMDTSHYHLIKAKQQFFLKNVFFHSLMVQNQNANNQIEIGEIKAHIKNYAEEGS